MSFLPHLIVTTLGVQLLGLRGAEALIAYAFGPGVLLVDAVVRFAAGRLRGKAAVPGAAPISTAAAAEVRAAVRRTALVEPISLLWIVPLSVYLASPAPVVFSAVRIALDYLAAPSKRPFFPFSSFSIDGLIPAARARAYYLTVALVAGAGVIMAGTAGLTDMFRSML